MSCLLTVPDIDSPRQGTAMKADEAAELMDAERGNRFKQKAAIAIAFFAMVLAITGMGGQNATKEMLNSNIEASNLYGFYQAKNIRQTSVQLAADDLQLRLDNETSLSVAGRAALTQKIEAYRKTIARYESEPETREGKKELLVRAKAQEQQRDHAMRQDPYFDYAEALLQIAIVLISVAIVSEQMWLSFAGGLLGLLGSLLMLNGFTLVFALPGFG